MASALQRYVAARPRVGGLGVTIMGLGLLGYNLWSLDSNGKFYGNFFLLGFCCVFLGVFVLITGRTEPPASLGLPPPPLWWRVGAIVIALAGLGLGVFVSETLRRQ